MQGANRRYDLIPWAAQNAVHPVTRMEHGDGAYIFDSEGRKYLDFSAQLVNVNLGHGHAKVVRAIQEQAARLCYIGPHFTTEARDALGAKLAKIAPGDIATAFFTDSGSEANEIAMTIARLVTGRRKIMTRYRSYHGTTSGALSASGDPRRVAVGYEQPNVVRIFDPYCHRCSFKLSYPECGVHCAASVEEVIQREGPEQIAALLAEPMTAAAAGIDPPAEYFPMLRRICDRYGILLIADEVITGFGRTGKWFAMNHWDVVPDMITSAKGLTSGYVPMGVVLMRDHIARHFDDNWIPLGSTQTANPIACAAAVAALDAYEEDGLIENAAAMGVVLSDSLEELKRGHACISDVRSLGLLACVELVSDAETGEPLSAKFGHGDSIEWIKRRVLELGLEVRVSDHFILIGPPLCITAQEIAWAVTVLDEILTEVEGRLVQ
ncbi:MAG: aminotransferase class III-fold pyridoxal phosphate-dependent enzyme [Alphaproteobacteria bacterium]|nr:aminotransferase class III-fold pyridoxal phosphate-dependent enzyme [Alphaproteobacteria bacterium]MDP6819379.1 aminotransferase class III-fold pyridoxal phosphate-dependent enzyme [Alphaproteobacteria bacterium]